GTYVNRQLIEHATELSDGDEVMIGKFRLTFFASHPGVE
ncbi:MAG TPA: FHA domain-containing protein, partial [Candidatus Avipropionibacterium avicola]|nr:FHA domain-containing protein [Candidatus Avipropionibacterium avicola]